MSEFLNMGGHGAFIWPCYAMALVVMLALLVHSVGILKKSRKDLKMMEHLDHQEHRAPDPVAKRQAS